MQVNKNQFSKNQTEHRAHGFLSDLNLRKGELVTIRPEASIEEAAQLMRKHHVGDLIVMKEKSERPLGIITDRDIVVECLGQNVQANSLKVSDIMSTEVVTAKITDSPFQIVHLMKKNGVTRIPILDIDESLVGIVTAKKITRLLVHTLEDLSDLSEQQRTREMEARH
jgi:CBS domain-containing protein